MLEMCTVRVPLVLVRVTVLGGLGMPTVCCPKDTLVGASLTAVPVPVSDTLCGLPGASSVILTAPVRVPIPRGLKFRDAGNRERGIARISKCDILLNTDGTDGHDAESKTSGRQSHRWRAGDHRLGVWRRSVGIENRVPRIDCADDVRTACQARRGEAALSSTDRRRPDDSRVCHEGDSSRRRSAIS